MATSTAPASGAAKWATSSSRPFPHRNATRSPGPHARGAQRVRRARDLRGQLVVGQPQSSPSTTAIRSAKTDADRSRNASGVSCVMWTGTTHSLPRPATRVNPGD